MEIDTITLLAYAIIWTLFYAFLSRHIAKLSRDRWVEYVKSEESDKVLVEALQAVIEEIAKLGKKVRLKVDSVAKTLFLLQQVGDWMPCTAENISALLYPRLGEDRVKLENRVKACLEELKEKGPLGEFREPETQKVLRETIMYDNCLMNTQTL